MSSARPADDWRCHTSEYEKLLRSPCRQRDSVRWILAMVNDETVRWKWELDEPYSGIQREAIALCPIQLETDPVIGRSSFWGKNDWLAVQIFGRSEQL